MHSTSLDLLRDRTATLEMSPNQGRNASIVHERDNPISLVRDGLRHPNRIVPEYRKTHRVAIRCKGRILLFNTIELMAIEGQGNYVLLQWLTRSDLVRASISDLARRLEPYGFVRIHRSAIINVGCAQELKALPTGAYCIRLSSGKNYTVGRYYKQNLSQLAELWIGAAP
jgi:DNA-binding LytR/AlgR family response regulator